MDQSSEKKFIVHADDEDFMRELVGEFFDNVNGQHFTVLSGKNGVASSQLVSDQYEYQKKEGRVESLQDFFNKFVLAIISDGEMPKMAGPTFMANMAACSVGVYSAEDLKSLLDDEVKQGSILQRQDLLAEISTKRQTLIQSGQENLVIPVVLTTGLMHETDRIKKLQGYEQMKNLITTILEKPFTPNDLYKAVGLGA